MNHLSAEAAHELHVLLQNTSRLAFKARGRELNRKGVSIMHASVLNAIHDIGYGATPAEIARTLIREPNTVTNLIRRMEKQGLVRKVKDLDRKNLVRVELTRKGKEAYAKTSAKDNTALNLMSGISDEESRILTKCLENIQEKAQKELSMSDYYDKYQNS